MKTLEKLLEASAALHTHLCPRQVLGVRMALLAGRILDLELPCPDKRLLVIVETDGCMVDGVAVVTGCSVGRRTLRIEDFGKIAATFVDTLKDRAVRIAPHSDARVRVVGFAPEAVDRWTAQLLGYQRMPDDLLLIWQWVKLTTPVAIIVGQDGQRTTCQHCHEEIINQREVARNGVILCRACAGSAYYQSVAPEIEGTRVTSPESPPFQGEGSIPPTPACP